jgi:hypothetical protein
MGAVVALALSGCSIISPMPSVELVKGVGAAMGVAMSVGPTSASQTVYHPHDRFAFLCISLNREATVSDVVPALQSELKSRGVDSRVFDGEASVASCTVWLSYVTRMDWDIPPFNSDYRPYLSSASLVLRTESGQVLSSSRYELGEFGVGKWATTRKKLAPVVQALLTGVEK